METGGSIGACRAIMSCSTFSGRFVYLLGGQCSPTDAGGQVLHDVMISCLCDAFVYDCVTNHFKQVFPHANCNCTAACVGFGQHVRPAPHMVNCCLSVCTSSTMFLSLYQPCRRCTRLTPSMHTQQLYSGNVDWQPFGSHCSLRCELEDPNEDCCILELLVCL